MTRLVHSAKAFRRSMQMSRHSYFVFVEGHEIDLYFYEKICQRALVGKKGSFQLVRAGEVSPTGNGGKQVLVEFWHYLKSRNALTDNFHGKKTLSMFFLDKDADDFLRKNKRSAHIVYTQYYCVENYLFEHGKFHSALAASLSSTESNLIHYCPNHRDWTKQIADRWTLWTAACMYARKHHLNCDIGFARPSTINIDSNYIPTRSDFLSLVQILSRASGTAVSLLQTKLSALERKLRRLLNQNMHHLYFKGKWYAIAAEREARNIWRFSGSSCNGLAKRLLATLLTSLDFHESWADHFCHPLARLD